MANDRVYLFSGSQDTVLLPGMSFSGLSQCIYSLGACSGGMIKFGILVGVVKKLAEYYSNFITTGSLVTQFSIPAEHAMVGGVAPKSSDYHMIVT